MQPNCGPPCPQPFSAPTLSYPCHIPSLSFCQLCLVFIIARPRPSVRDPSPVFPSWLLSGLRCLADGHDTIIVALILVLLQKMSSNAAAYVGVGGQWKICVFLSLSPQDHQSGFRVMLRYLHINPNFGGIRCIEQRAYGLHVTSDI